MTEGKVRAKTKKQDLATKINLSFRKKEKKNGKGRNNKEA